MSELFGKYRLPLEVKYCKKCTMSNQRPSFSVEYMDITLQDYHDTIEKFRTPYLWEKRYGNWELKKPIWKQK